MEQMGVLVARLCDASPVTTEEDLGGRRAIDSIDGRCERLMEEPTLREGPCC